MMKLSHLKTACYLYNQITNYDENYRVFRNSNPQLELDDEQQVKSLLELLRKWGCRQFNKDDEAVSVDSIMSWYKQYKAALPAQEERLLRYDLEKNRVDICHLFSELSDRIAGTKQRKSTAIKYNARIGPVGAAKTLFFLRPDLFSPWDNPIITDRKVERDGNGYVDYLAKIQNELNYIEVELEQASMSWDDLPKFLKKKHTHFPKLIDEYFWITITRKCDPAEIEKFFHPDGLSSKG